jgi:hypothetical protein
MKIEIKTEGRRHYLIGETYSAREAIRSAGCRWDPERRAWYSGKRDAAEAALRAVERQSLLTGSGPEPQREVPGANAIVAGRARYKGRTYYLAGRKSYHGDTVQLVTSRDGSRRLLYFRDGSCQFWASAAEISVEKRYEYPKTIRGLREYAQRARAQGGDQLEEGYYYAPNGEVLTSGCGACRSLGHMCQSCEHDYD